MKSIYIKPEMEELISASEGILCASTQWGTNYGGTTNPIGNGEPDPSFGARESEGFFEDDEF